MSAIKPTKTVKTKTSRKSTVIIGAIIGGIGLLLFAYLMFYVSPEQTFETVKVIAITSDGCIVETLDGHPMNIGQCNAQPGQFIEAIIDQKIKERSMLMNP
ncbi:conserved exported hypothetical protein [metagenome]